MIEEQSALRWPLATLQGLPAIGIGIYVFGFVATNTHLGKFGIYEFDLASSRYVIVGILYVVFLAFWCFFAGRSVLEMEWYEAEVEEQDTFGSRLSEWIELGYSICVSTALFALIFLGSADAVFFCALAALGWIIEPRWENLWESKGLYRHFPWGEWIMYPSMRVLAITLFFSTIEIDSLAMSLFIHLLVLTLYARFVLRKVKRYRSEREHSERKREDFLKTSSHVVSFLLLSCISFGWLQYGQIDPGFGGGKTRNVEMVVVDQNTTRNLKNLGILADPSFMAEVIHEDEYKIIAKVGGKTVSITRDAVAGVQVVSAGSFDLGLYGKRVLIEIVDQWEDLYSGNVGSR